MLESLFESPVKEKALLFIHAAGPSYAREIARTFSLNLSSVQNQLFKLEAGGVLYSRLRGRVRLFDINPRYAFRTELGRLLDKALEFLPEGQLRLFRPRMRPRRAGKPL
jgi:DNA-binding transcriptional ArsR family regulator